tara:strand:+ start:275 stop:427 length:153 start_codon:yes stop_codon:yes gene_type:complete
MLGIVDYLFGMKVLSYFDEEIRAIIIVLGFYALLVMGTSVLYLNMNGPLF